jgi:glycerate 2-kinase
MAVESPQVFLRQLFDAAVHRALPHHQLARHLPPPPKGRTLLIGAGKAGAAMVHALEAAWPAEAPLSGLVVTRYGHTPPRPSNVPARVEIVEAAHPVPDEAGMRAAMRMLDMTRGLNADDLVLCLISGGGSALLSLPAEGLSLDDKQAINRQLLRSGANIQEMNCVRKHLSRIKGGRLAAACAPARVLTLAISDVPGDDPSTIASGPTVPDETTCQEAWTILKRHGIALPPAVAQALQNGYLETPKPGARVFQGHEVRLIATPFQSLEAAATLARQQGLNTYILSDEIEGESREVGKVHAALARSVALGQSTLVKPCVILSGGETTVTVSQRHEGSRPGRGGRAGEFCLGLAEGLKGHSNIWALAADTDGIDGVETNAGAFVTPTTLSRARHLGLSLPMHMENVDSYGFFSGLDDLLFTGPTFTNVNDFRAILIV